MAASQLIEEETGSFTGRLHPHNGYYAGDFFASVDDWSVLVAASATVAQ